MAQFDEPLPSLAFPSELDTLVIQCDNNDPLPIVIYVDSTLVFQTTLYPDSSDMVTLFDLAELLQDNIPARRASTITIGLYDHAESVTVIPSRTDIAQAAGDFAEAHFLTLLDGAKPTYIGAKEFIPFYSTASQPNPAITCLWVNPSTGETQEAAGRINSVTHFGNHLFTAYFQPERFVCPADGFMLHSFRVELGARRQEYIIHTPIDCDPFSLQFCNNFGQTETFHCFGTMEKELKPNRQTASFNGKTRNYKIEAVPTWKCHTGVLPESVQPLFADLCATTEAYRLDNGTEVTITDNELKLSNDRYEVQTGSVTFRETARTAMHSKRNVHHSTFDQTFDNTFD